MLEDLSNDSKCQTHEKQQVSVNANETKILGLHRNKIADKIGIRFPEKDENETNCELLKYLAGIYNPLGILSPVSSERHVT